MILRPFSHHRFQPALTGLLLLLISVIGCAQARPQAPSSELEALSWMTGYWKTEAREGRITEEHWMAPKGGLMLGVNRVLEAGAKGQKAVFFEYLRIEEKRRADGRYEVVLLASPQGRPATPFRLVESGEKWATFANPQHDFPQRITYRLEADGSLHAEVEGVERGRPQSSRWVYRRAGGPGGR